MERGGGLVPVLSRATDVGGLQSVAEVVFLNTTRARLCTFQGRRKFRPGTIPLRTISPGDNSVGGQFRQEIFATLEIPQAPSAIRPNDCNNTTRHAPDRHSKTATHCHNKEGQCLQRQFPDRQHQISYVCARNGWLRRVRKRLALLRKHNPSAAVAKDGTVPPKFRHFFNDGIFPAKLSLAFARVAQSTHARRMARMYTSMSEMQAAVLG